MIILSDFGSLIFYIVSFSLSVLLYKFSLKYKSKFFLVLSMAIPLVIGGFRYMVGTDYITYMAMYKNNIPSNVGMSIIYWLTNLLGGSYVTVFFIYNMLTVIFCYAAISRLNIKNRPLALFVYYFLFYTASFNIIKQGLAISIIFFAFKYIDIKKPTKWIIMVLIATMFHTTALLCLPFYFIFNVKSKKTKIALLVLFSIAALGYQEILSVLSNTSLLSHYEMYTNDYAGAINNRMFFVDLIMLLLSIIVLKTKNKSNNMYMFITAIGVILEMTGFINPFVKRIADYFLICKVPILAELPYAPQKQKNKQTFLFTIITIIILLFIVSSYVLKNAGVIPYTMIGIL